MAEQKIDDRDADGGAYTVVNVLYWALRIVKRHLWNWWVRDPLMSTTPLGRLFYEHGLEILHLERL